MRSSIIVVLMLAGVLAACVDIPQYDNTPSIAFNSITKYVVVDQSTQKLKDSIIITVDFTDGDGDLGVSRDQANDPKYSDWGNYQLRTFIIKPDKSEIEIPLSQDQFMFFQQLKPEGKPGPIKGKLDLGYKTEMTYSDPSNTMIPIRFKIKIRDRALRASQEVSTDTIWTPLPKDLLDI